MVLMRVYLWHAIGWLLIFPGLLHAAIPPDQLLQSLRPTADVNDYAELLSPAERDEIEAQCRSLREKTGAELAVVTLPSLQGGELEDFTNKLFAQWKIGQAGKDNGLLLLVAQAERQVRIEVGYGLEPVIPDALAGRIIDQQIRPNFRQGNYAAGLKGAVQELVTLVERGEPADVRRLAEPPATLSEKIIGVLFLAVFVAIGSRSIGMGAAWKLPQNILFGLMFSGIPMLLGFALGGALGPIIHLPVALASMIFGYHAAKNGGGSSDGGQGGRSGNSGNWQWRNFPGPSGGWSTGNGGFSQGWGGFGGGRSGGGGASGGW